MSQKYFCLAFFHLLRLCSDLNNPTSGSRSSGPRHGHGPAGQMVSDEALGSGKGPEALTHKAVLLCGYSQGVPLELQKGRDLVRLMSLGSDCLGFLVVWGGEVGGKALQDSQTFYMAASIPNHQGRSPGFLKC